MFWGSFLVKLQCRHSLCVHIHFQSSRLFYVGNQFGKSYPFFSLLQPKYCKEKRRHSPLALGRAVPSSLPKVNGCAALFQMGAEGYLGGTWAAALPCTALCCSGERLPHSARKHAGF